MGVLYSKYKYFSTVLKKSRILQQHHIHSKSILKPKSDEEIIKLTVELTKFPLYFDENTEIKVEIVAEPIY